MRLGRLLPLVAALGLLVGSGAAAQTPDSLPKRDSLPRRDSLPARADSVKPADPIAKRDSLVADSLRALRDSVTRDYIRLQDRVTTRVPVAPRLGGDGPLPAGGRLLFTRDSLNWLDAETVGDLLRHVPGAYVWRGGWLGRAEYGNFRGRGAASVEYTLDGVPFVAAGIDSVGVDGSLFPLSLFERVEIETLPGLVKVHLYTLQNDRLAARSHIDLGTGSAGLTRFSAALEQNNRKGVQLTLAADYLNSAFGVGNGATFRNTAILARLGWVPTPRYGIQLQYLRNRPRRPPYADLSSSAGVDTGYAYRRSDTQLRAFWRAREDGYGAGLDLIGARTLVRDTLADSLQAATPGLEQSIYSLGLIAGVRSPTSYLTASATAQSRWTSLDAEGRAGLTAGGRLTLAADARYLRHDGGRTSAWVGGRASLLVVPGLTLTGSARVGRAVAAPSVLSDTAQTLREFEGGAILAPASWLTLYGSVTRTAAWTPPRFQPFADIVAIGDVPATTWVTGGARLAPFGWLTLESWASTPAQGSPVGQPPRHAVSTGTIRSKFLRTFPSGIFDLKLQAGVEYFDVGVLGIASTGGLVSTSRTAHVFTQVELQLSSFTFYFHQNNTGNQLVEYVPGFRIPRYANSFGIRWGFTN